MADTEWINSLKVGDRVVAKDGDSRLRPLTLRIDTISGAFIVTSDGEKWHRKTGWKTKKMRYEQSRGYSYGQSWRLVGTVQVVGEKREREQLCDRIIKETRWGALKERTTDQLRRIVAILDEPKAGEHHGEQAGEGDGRKDGKA